MFDDLDDTPNLPANPQAERELLGTSLLNPEAAAWLRSMLKPEHFCEPVHQRIFKAVGEFQDAGKIANPITLKAVFDEDPSLKSIGGAQYLVKLAAGASAIPTLTDYAAEIVRCWHLRQIIEACQKAKLTAMDASQDPEAIWAELRKLGEIESAKAAASTVSDEQATEAIIARLETGLPRYSTGISALDEAMGGGLYAGKMYGFAASHKVGKTILAATISYNLAAQGIKHLFVCGEMGSEEVQERMVCRALNCFPSELKPKDPLDVEERKRIAARVISVRSRYQSFCVYQNAPRLTFDDLKTYLQSAVRKDKIKGVVVDYFQLIGGCPASRSKADWLAEAAQWMAGFVRENGIFCLMPAQLNRNGEVAESSGFEKACDQFYFLHRENRDQPQAWLEMKATRYTKWMDVGSADYAGLMLSDRGLHFTEKFDPEIPSWHDQGG